MVEIPHIEGESMRYSFEVKDRTLPLFVDSVGYDWPQEAIHRPHGYPYVHWLQTDSGAGVVTLQHETLTLKPGQGLLINQAIPHQYHATPSGWKTSYFTFGGALITEIMAALGFRDYLYVQDPDAALRDFILNHANDMHDAIGLNRYGASELVYDFLLRLKQYTQDRPGDRQLYTNIIAPVMTIIQTKYDQTLTNNDFVDAAHYSIQYILAAFRTYYGRTPNQMLQEYRIKLAKERLLNHPDESIEAIGQAVGFNTNSYFIATFKQLEEITPGKLRQYYH